MVIPRRILVVEKDDGVRKLLGDILTQAGYGVDLCRNEQDALQKFDPGVYVLLILEEETVDATTPSLDPFRARNNRVPIVLLYNGAGTPGPIGGMIDVERLTKPFRPIELLGTLKRLLPSS